MTVTLEVGPETEVQARQAAQREGMSLEDYLAELLEDTFAHDAALADLAAEGGAKPLTDVLREIEAERAREKANGAL